MPAKLHNMGLADLPKPDIAQPFNRIQQYLEFIRDKKTIKMFDKVHLVYQKGPASFVNPHTVRVADETYSAKRIFICIGTWPEIAYTDSFSSKAVDHDWSYATFGLATKLKLSKNLSFVPGLCHQISIDDSVSKRDITYCKLSMKYKF